MEINSLGWSFLTDFRETIKYELAGLGLVAVGVLSGASLLTDGAGPVGLSLRAVLRQLLGGSAFVVPLLLVAAGGGLLLRRTGLRFGVQTVGLALLCLCLAALLHVSVPAADVWDVALSGHGGGLIGAAVSFALERTLGPVGRAIILLTVAVSGLVLLTRVSLAAVLAEMQASVVRGWSAFATGVKHLFARQEAAAAAETAREPAPEPEQEPQPRQRRAKRKAPPAPAVEEPSAVPTIVLPEPEPVAKVEVPEKAEEQPEQRVPEAASLYVLPPLDLLKAGSGGRTVGREELMERSQLLEQTLRSFGVEARVSEIHPGPAVTRYELQPAPGVRVNRITNLQQDLALALAAQQIRIEAPVPGKAAIGIEVPNQEVDAVLLRDLLESPEMREATGPLTVALGRDIAGRPVVANLEKMPHLLIAGATGSGKSVCINTIIMSLLLRTRPDEVKLMLIDPKMVELNNYGGVPHLTAPVITDPKKAAGYLLGAVKEMEARYELFSQAGVRDIDRYNALVAERSGRASPPAMPKQVIIIDELADLMMVAPVDVEDAISRLAAMARAAGLHLILATQRPSVDVITGVIKANIPSRIAFAVASQIDSRTILDGGGAERLLGRGDMLFLPVGAAKPMRVQGAYVSEAEIEAVVNFCRKQTEPRYEAEAVAISERTASDEQRERPADALFAKAVWVVIENGQASVSILQRRLRISYNRAARLIDDMEAQGLIGPHQGSRPRDLLISAEDYQRLFGAETSDASSGGQSARDSEDGGPGE